MRIVTWNVNSVRARYDRLLNWLDQHQPDVLCLQELKALDEEFPVEEVGELGYFAETFGQRTYNGVAILAREPIEDVVRGFGDGVEDPAARLIAGTVGGVRVVSVYVPNGGKLGSTKWTYKLEWYARLRAWLDRHHTPAEPLVVCGDFNVAPDDRDAAFPELWHRTVLACPEARAALEQVTRWGLVDTLRLHHADGGHYSWWDYRAGGFEKDDGLRIDLVLATRPLADRCTGVLIDREERADRFDDKPSDHVPVGADFDWPS